MKSTAEPFVRPEAVTNDDVSFVQVASSATLVFVVPPPKWDAEGTGADGGGAYIDTKLTRLGCEVIFTLTMAQHEFFASRGSTTRRGAAKSATRRGRNFHKSERRPYVCALHNLYSRISITITQFS